MKLRVRTISLFALALACSLVTPSGAAAAEASPAADDIGPALEKRIRGEASLDDVRIDVGWTRQAKYLTARIYGNGVVICDGKLQFTVKKADVVAILKTLEKARFGSMPSHYGEAEGEEEEEEKNEGPRLKGRIAVRAGPISKSVQQMAEGEQSEPFEALAVKILGVCQGASRGVGAQSLADGLQKVVSRSLAPEVLEVTVQRRAENKKDRGQSGWILEIEGRRATDQRMPVGQMPPAPRLLILSAADFLALAAVLEQARPGEIPLNVYASVYTDLRVTLLNQSRVISGRRFQSMTAETHGEKQKAFDRIIDAFQALHERVQKEGKPVRVVTPSPDSRKEEQEREREREKKEKEKEKD